MMEHLLQPPRSYDAQASYPLWLVLHGAFAKAEQAIDVFGPEADEHGVFLLAPQATRPCGDGYCWSFARDAKEIHQLIERTCATYPIDRTRLSLIGYDDGGIDEKGLSASAGTMRVLLAVDQSDPAGTNTYFDNNLDRLRKLGLQVETFRPNAGTHAVTEEMKAAVLQAMPK
jgi:poly(3-hydroxybutyrate) depolymerase